MIFENFLEWIDQWVIETKKVISDLDKLRELYYSNDNENSGELKKSHEQLEIRLAQLIKEYSDMLHQFHSNSVDLEKTDIKAKSIREIVFAAIEILHKVSFYYSGSESGLIFGLQSYLLYLRSALKGQWDLPTSSILQLDLDWVIQKHLFYHNGVATIGQLKQAVDSDEKLLMIGSSRIVKIQKALLLKQFANEKEGQLPTIEERPDVTQSNSPGIWKLITNGKPEFYIEFNDTEVHIVANNCSIRIFPDGRVITQLANC